MAGIEPNGLGLLAFGAAFAVCCLGFFTVAGMFPLSARPAALAGLPAAALIIVNLGLVLLLALAAVLFAHQSLRWTSAVVLGGLIFLFTPAAFQAVPDHWRDTPSGLVGLGLIQAATLAAIAAPLHLFAS